MEDLAQQTIAFYKRLNNLETAIKCQLQSNASELVKKEKEISELAADTG